jgi:hypothetical protein
MNRGVVGLPILAALLIAVACSHLVVAETLTGIDKSDSTTELWMANQQIRCTIQLRARRLIGDRIEAVSGWSTASETSGNVVATDAGFALDLMWTDWRAPGKVHNGDNPAVLGNEVFSVSAHRFVTRPDGGAELILELGDDALSLQIEVTYRLDPDTFFVRKRIAVRDPKKNRHLLRQVWPMRGDVLGIGEVLKGGGFGEPIGLRIGSGGAFFGIEYPAASNEIELKDDGTALLRAGHEYGELIGEEWLASEWLVIGLSPDRHVKRWFDLYLEDIRVAPPRPYLLYNTWYDVRSPEYTDRPEDVMNDASLRRIIVDFARIRTEWPDISLDAFVLDDGWDVYESDWLLREQEFPGGLRPIAQALEAMGTDLGIWFGPTGGYSFRNKRVNWMGEHGYEVTGNQLCVAGARYRELLKKRTVDLVRNHGVAYFKWDGIQFSCSEPDHGHAIGLPSR